MSLPVSPDAEVRTSTASGRQSGQADRGPVCPRQTESEMIGAPGFELVADRSGGVKVSAAERWLARRMLRAIGDPPVRIVLCNGEEIPAAGPPPVARLLIHDRPTFRRLLLDPDLQFGDGYSAGRIDVEGDLLEFLETLHRARMSASGRAGLLRRTISRLRQWRQSNTRRGSRANIHHHYDIGNDFYKLWLDDQLVYTCAYFPTPQASLEQAQVAKMDHVCRKLWLKPGETVVEAGCGWGALGLHMAQHYGVKVKAFNISHEQIVYARQRAKQAGLSSRAEFIEDDYRAISGRFDAFVSVGMLEHVGADRYHEFGRVIDGCLSPRGRGLIHSIGQDRPGELTVWLTRRIFPGAYTPTLREMTRVLEPWGFSVLDVENLRLHYAQTLRHWLRRFESAADVVAGMFDRRFVRMWRLYLAGSVTAFASGALQLYQVVFARPGVNEIPWTRARLYGGSTAPDASVPTAD